MSAPVTPMAGVRQQVYCRGLRLGDVTAVWALVEEVQTGAAREEVLQHLTRFLNSNYIYTAIALTWFLVTCITQAQMWWVISLSMAVVVVTLMEAGKFWIFWTSIRHVFSMGKDIQDIENYYHHPRRVFVVAVVNGEVAGVVAAIETVDPSRAKLWRMFVHPGYRRIGVASRLISACLEECKMLAYTGMVLRTHTNNKKAMACYEKAGFIRGATTNFKSMFPHQFDTTDYHLDIPYENYESRLCTNNDESSS